MNDESKPSSLAPTLGVQSYRLLVLATGIVCVLGALSISWIFALFPSMMVVGALIHEDFRRAGGLMVYLGLPLTCAFVLPGGCLALYGAITKPPRLEWGGIGLVAYYALAIAPILLLSVLAMLVRISAKRAIGRNASGE